MKKMIIEYAIVDGMACLSRVKRYGPFDNPTEILNKLGVVQDYISYIHHEYDRPGDWPDALVVPNPNIEDDLRRWADDNKIKLTIKNGKAIYDGGEEDIKTYIYDLDASVNIFARVFEIVDFDGDEVPSEYPFKNEDDVRPMTGAVAII
jgi:hypothetical protein